MQYTKIANQLLGWNFTDSSSFETKVCGEWIIFTKATVIC